ncbi:PAQR family membrane homeostasis protein TrhA [Pleionea sediminis]|uniref:PAQR family membrane homeostasis protein TrhA n=1 Tax=Pleionea sediminis TaxID=2569479 RepID=UPI0011857DCF|nr:hemolysin III family protein [Pleionea sediminis]
MIKNSDYSKTEERLNVITHGIGFVVAIVGLVFLVLRADGAMAIASVSVYGATLVFMLLASTLYHAITHHEIRPQLKLLDHSAIYLLIAGTYTPFMLVALDDWVGIAGAIIIWALAFSGLIFKWVAKHKFPKVSLALYLLMGWLVVVLIYPLYKNVDGGGLWLLFAGGICFSVGAAFYAAKHLRFTHAIWHGFVLAGCTCHFLSIYLFVI